MLAMLLIEPQRENVELDEGHVLAVPDPVELDRQRTLYRRFRLAISSLGARSMDTVVTMQGRDWEGEFDASAFQLDDQVVSRLEGIVMSRESLRASGLAKLTDAERDALGFFDRKPSLSRG